MASSFLSASSMLTSPLDGKTGVTSPLAAPDGSSVTVGTGSGFFSVPSVAWADIVAVLFQVKDLSRRRGMVVVIFLLRGRQ
jgi:hypothetical protein